MLKSIVSIIAILSLLYVAMALLLFFFQRDMIYHPTAKVAHSYPTLAITQQGETVNVIVVNSGQDNAFIYFGGNAEPVVANATDFAQSFPNTTIYLVEYRGYGDSTGQASEHALFSDALAVFDAVRPEHSNIAVVGRSLGSGVAVHLATQRPVSSVVLITPFDSLVEVAKNHYKYFPISVLVKDRFDSVAIASKISAPVLIVAGAKDTLIPLAHSERLFAQISSAHSRLLTIEHAGHNDIMGFSSAYLGFVEHIQAQH